MKNGHEDDTSDTISKTVNFQSKRLIFIMKVLP